FDSHCIGGGMAALEELTGSVRSVVERVGPAVVGLGRGWGRGSGVVVAPGRVITNAHNLRGDEVTVTLADGRTGRGEVAGVDADGDLAAIAVDTGDAVARPRLGVAIAPARVARRLRRAVGLPELDGLLVHGVERGGPAARAGIEKGDLLVRAGERELVRVDDLHAALDSTPPGG